MKWNIKPKAPAEFFRRFPEYPPLIAQLLYNRGLESQKQVDEFFNPDYEADLHDPCLLKGIKKAVNRIEQAINKKEKITVYGDFDADGVCAAVILFSVLKHFKAKKPDIYIPDREKENHGLNETAIRELAQKGTKLIITVDCASTDIKEVDLANSLGLEVIVTDHHQPNRTLPKAVAFINPWQKGDRYPFKELSGAGVAYKLASALLGKDNSLKKWLLDLAALATVTDVMPIIGENRTLVRYGLGVLAQTRRVGLRELMKTAGVESKITRESRNGEAPTTNLNVNTLGFVLGPRINAASRMDHANMAFHLLTTKDKNRAGKLAEQLNKKNTERQNLTLGIVKEIEGRLEEKMETENPKIIFEGSPDWPVGLVGLIAAKITDRYCRPAVIYYENENFIHASCRSIPEFDLMESIKKTRRLLDDYGGHKRGAGFRAKKENLPLIKEMFEKMAERELRDEDFTPTIEIDAELSLADIAWENYDQIQKFAPFGRANPEPRFLIKGLEIRGLRAVGNNNGHLKMDLVCFDHDSRTAKNFKAIAFGSGHLDGVIKKGNLIDAVFELTLNEWNGTRDLEMKIIDLRITQNL